jgi:hypothetical protein
MNSEQYFENGRFKLATNPHEMRMSHWVYAPVLTDTITEEVLFDLSGNIWDLQSASESSKEVILKLARYPDINKEFEIVLKLNKGQAKINGNIFPINNLSKVLDGIA